MDAEVSSRVEAWLCAPSASCCAVLESSSELDGELRRALLDLVRHVAQVLASSR